MLVDAGIAHEVDGGQKLLEGLIFLCVVGLFAGFGFAEAEVVFEAAADCVVEGELEDVVGDRVGGDAAVEGIVGGGGIGGLGA